MIEVDLSKPGMKSGVLRALKSLGVQDEAERFRLEVTQELVGSGLKLLVAREKSWVEMVRLFLPRDKGEKLGVFKTVAAEDEPPWPKDEALTVAVHEPEEQPEESAADPDPEAMATLLKKLSPVDFFEDICWVYLNLAHKDVRPDQAPNAGAWGLLEHVRKYPRAFFDQLLPKALAKAPDEEEGVKKEKRRIEEIEEMLVKLKEAEEP